MQTPSTVKISFWIFLIGIILDVVGAVMLIFAGMAVATSKDTVTVGTTAVNGGVLITSGVLALVFAAIGLLILWKMKAGKNWARIVLTVLEVLSLGSLFGGTNGIGITALVLGIVAVVLMWLPASNAYFRKA